MESRAPRAAVPLAASLLGFLAVTAALQPQQASREIRRLELADLVREEDDRVRGLRGQVRELEVDLAALREGSASTGSEARRLQEEVRSLSVRGGGTAVRGPGVVVTLDDSSAGRSPTGDPNDLIVHERDIQTVVNALWAAGAEAVAVDGERLTSASAVRCAGNTLLLHGTLHSPPYEIAAIGEPGSLTASFLSGPGVERLRAAVRSFGIGLSIEPGTVDLGNGPPLGDLRLARPAP